MSHAGGRSGDWGPLLCPSIVWCWWVLTCVGAALGAALMLGGRRLGCRIYTGSNIVHLIATAGVMLLWIMSVYLSVVGVLLFFYCFIPLGFLLYFRRNGAWLR